MNIDIEITPNPNAKKFIVNNSLLENKIYKQYNSIDEANENPLAYKLFSILGIESIFFIDNIITINKDNNYNWSDIENNIKIIINDNINYLIKNIDEKLNSNPIKDEKLIQVTKILNETVKPILAMDGGGIEVVKLDDDMKLYVKYHGACGSCPSSTMATLTAITYMLKENFDNSIEVIPV